MHFYEESELIEITDGNFAEACAELPPEAFDELQSALTGERVFVHKLTEPFDTILKLYCIAYTYYQQTQAEQIGVFDNSYFIINSEGKLSGPLIQRIPPGEADPVDLWTAATLTGANEEAQAAIRAA